MIWVFDHGISYTGDYGIFIERPNNPSSTTPITFGQTISGSIDPSTEIDFYTFSANAGDTVIIRLDRTSGSLYPEVRLYAPNGSLLDSQWSYGSSIDIQHTLPETGKYMIWVFDHGISYTGGYGIFVQRTNDPGTDTPIAFGETISASINVTGDVDTYTFSANAGDTVLVTMSVTSTVVEPQIRLYGPDGTELAESYSEDYTTEISHTLNQTGQYTVLACDYNRNDTGGYGIFVQRTNDPGTDTPIAFGETISASINVTGDVDTYTFSANAGDTVLVTMSVTSTVVEPQIRLYGPDGTELAESYSEDYTTEISHTLNQTGQYTVLTCDYNRNDTGGYTIFLKEIIFEELALGVPYIGSITQGDWQRFYVAVEAGINLLVTLEPESLTGAFELYGSYGQSPSESDHDFVTKRESVWGNYELLIAPTEAGTYYFAVYGKSVEGTVSYQITASDVDRHVSDIYPKILTNTTGSALHILGIGFINGMDIELRNGDASVISADTVVVTSPDQVISHFNLSGSPLGTYNMAAIWPDSYEELIESAVEIKELQEGALYSFPNLEATAGETLEYPIVVTDIGNLFITLQKTTLVSYGNSWSCTLSLKRDGTEIASTSGSHDLILHIIDPVPGLYTVTIAPSRSGSGILTIWTALPELPLGEWMFGTIYTSYGSIWHQVNVPPEQDALYLDAEAMGLWSHFDVYYGEYGSPDHWVSRQGTRVSMEIPDPSPGMYIVEFLDSAMLIANGGYSEDQARDVLLKADTAYTIEPPLEYLPTISSLSTNSGGNSGPITVEIQGAWLDPDATVSLIRVGYEYIEGQDTYGTPDRTKLTTTFNFLGEGPGEWILVVTNPDDHSTSAPEPFTILEGGEGDLWFEIVGRETIRVGRPTQYFLNYGNSGDVDIPAPLFIISTTAPPFSKFIRILSVYPLFDYYEETVKVLGKGSESAPGILPPGRSYSIPLELKATITDAFELQVSVITNNLLFSVDNLATPTDAFCPAPGIPLAFSRTFPQSSMQSQYFGPFGYRWLHSYDIHLEELSDSTIALLHGNSYSHLFLSNDDGTYSPLRGYTSLILNPDGTYEMREKDGTVLGFRTDLRFDYILDTNGNRINAVYNPDNQLIQLQHSCGDSFNLEYNDNGCITRLVDHTGNVTEYQYDATGELLINVIAPDGAVTNYGYASSETGDGLALITYPEGIQQSFEYDGDGRLSEVYLDSDEELVRFNYDMENAVTYITDADGKVTTICSDEFGQTTGLRNPLGAVYQFDYDEDFNLIMATDPLGNTTAFDYDDRGNIVSITNALNHELSMEYDTSFSKIAWVQDARGNEITFDYDEHGNLLDMTYPDSSTQSMGYDSIGNLDDVTTRNGDIIGYTYNDRGQITRIDHPDSSWIAYEYDDFGNIISATDENGRIEMEYNAKQLLSKVAYPTGHFLEYNYDDAGRLILRVDQDSNTLNYAYDVASRLERIFDGSGSDIVRYEYDAVGRINKKMLGSGAYTTYEYDAAGQILHLVNYDDASGVISRFDNTYDLNGNPISITTLEGTHTYQYDALGQLTKVTYPDSSYTNYTYDAVGNRITVSNDGTATTYTTNNMNQYTSVGDTSFSYDTNGNLISKTDDGQTTTYEYNYENRLTRVTSPEGTWEYTYDPLGNRVGMVHDGIEHRYLVDPMGFGDVVAEYDGDWNLLTRYTHGLGLISQIDADGDPFYYHFSPTGHTTEISDGDGDVVNSYKYSPFGIYLEKDEAIQNPFGFVGEFGVMDDGNGLNYMRMRYYQPDLGRFSSEEPLWYMFANQIANTYSYVENCPIEFIDPLGLQKSLPERFADWIGDMSERFADWIGDISEPIATWGPLPWGVGPLFNMLNYPYQLQKRDPTTLQNIGEAINWFKDPLGRYDREIERALGKPIDPVGSSTPEDKYGPTGFDQPDTSLEERSRFMPADLNFYYKVDFWNAENATAPAYDVLVVDQLEPDIDWSKLRFEEIGFLDWTVDLDPCQYFNVNVDTRPTMDVIVNVEGTFDQDTGEAQWNFRSLDPETMETPEDPMAGFLPPITESGREIGWVCFSAKTETGLLTGTKITNQAFVEFDHAGDLYDHPAPKEGPWINTIDAEPPTSEVPDLPTQVSSSSFNVSWSGNDDLDGSGIASYDIYYSDNGGAYIPWFSNTKAISAYFVGISGHTYSFYSVARDNVGNVEEAPSEPDTTTTIQVIGLTPWDVNQDGCIDISDLVLIGQHWYETGPDGWIPEDVNDDGVIDISDLVLVGQHWQEGCGS